MAGKKKRSAEQGGGSASGRLVREVSAQHAELLAKLREELGDGAPFSAAAERLARDFGAVTETAVEAAADPGVAAAASGDGQRPDRPAAPPIHAEAQRVAPPALTEPAPAPAPVAEEAQQELPSLYRPGQMRRRLDQLVETNRRYGHPFGLAVFDASGPGTRNGDAGGGRETVLAIIGAALQDSIRLVDEAFRLEEDAILVLAPNQRTVEGVQMAERLLGQLDELERAGGLRIAVAAGVVACPEHGADPDELLHRADAALWRARAVGQPVGVGALAGR